MHILSSMRSITFPWSRSSKEDADDASSDSGEDPEADSDDDSTSVGGFSKAKILYTTLVILLLFGTVFGGGFATSAAVQHSKANSAAFYEQLYPGQVTSFGPLSAKINLIFGQSFPPPSGSPTCTSTHTMPMEVGSNEFSCSSAFRTCSWIFQNSISSTSHALPKI